MCEFWREKRVNFYPPPPLFRRWNTYTIYKCLRKTTAVSIPKLNSNFREIYFVGNQ